GRLFRGGLRLAGGLPGAPRGLGLFPGRALFGARGLLGALRGLRARALLRAFRLAEDGLVTVRELLGLGEADTHDTHESPSAIWSGAFVVARRGAPALPKRAACPRPRSPSSLPSVKQRAALVTAK